MIPDSLVTTANLTVSGTTLHLKLRLYDKIRRIFSRCKFCETTLFLRGILYRGNAAQTELINT